MTIFISPIGVTTEHVKGWLAEESRGVQILWLIHSKKGKTDFPKIAKKLKKDLQSAYPRLKIKLKTIASAFEIDPTMDAISEIIHKEMDEGNVLTNNEFTLNITGGTNVMAAATMISATWHNTKAHYVLEPQKNDPADKQYVLDLPVKSRGIAKMKENQLNTLKIINDSNYYIENTPEGIEPKIIKGSITRQNLLEKVNDLKEKKKTNKQTSKTKVRLEYIVKELEKAGYIEKIGFVEYYVYKDKEGRQKKLERNTVVQKKNKKLSVEIQTEKGVEFIEWPLNIKRNEKLSRYQITPAGKRTARDAYMFD
jgi:hypothetical protein